MTDAIVSRTVTIYKITSVTGRSYVGATVNIAGRLSSHLGSASRGTHRSPLFQAEYDAVGKEGFTLSTLAVVPIEDRVAQEDFFIKLHGAELNGVLSAVPFRDKAHIDKVNAAKRASPMAETWCLDAREAAHKVLRRKVLCVETGEVFDSVRAAGDFAGGHRLGVALQKPNCTAYGYHWQYADDNYRPRTGKFLGRSKTKIRVIATGEVFDGHPALKAWYAAQGIKIAGATISQACTIGCRAKGYYLERVDI